MKSQNRVNIPKWVIHPFFCITFIYFFGNYCDLRPASYPALYKEYITGIITITVIYLEYLFFFPKFFLPRKYMAFWICTISSVILSGCLEMLLVYPEVKEVYLNSCSVSKLKNYIIIDTFHVTLRNGGWVLFAFAAREIQRLRQEATEKENIIQKQYKFVDVRDSNYKIGVINSENIYYCIQEKNIVTVHSVDSGIYYRYCSMKNMENLLGSKEFVRISQNAIVPKRFINKYDGSQLELRKLNKFTDNIILPVGDSYKEQIIKQIKLEIGKDDTYPVGEIEKSKKKHRETHTFIPKQKTKSEDFEHNSKLRAVYLHIKSHPGCKVNDICTTCRLPQGTVRRYIGFLMGKHFIQHTGSRRYGGYSIVSKD